MSATPRVRFAALGWDARVSVPLSGRCVRTTIHVTTFRIDRATGGLVAAEVPPLSLRVDAGESGPSGTPAAHPNGRLLFVALPCLDPRWYPCRGRGEIATLTIDAQTGALAEAAGARVPTSADPVAAAFDAAGGRLYVAGFGDPAQLYGPCAAPDISAYGVDDAGRLTDLPGSPFAGGLPTAAMGVGRGVVFALHALRRYSAYEIPRDQVNAYRVGADGGVRQIAGVDFDVPGAPTRVAAHPSGRFVVVRVIVSSFSPTGSARGELQACELEASDRLRRVADAPAIVPGLDSTLLFSPDGRFVYAGTAGFSVDVDSGRLTPVVQAAPEGPGPAVLVELR